MSSQKTPAIGIDLGTTFSCIGVFQNGTVEIIANIEGNLITPSYVAFTSTKRLIGNAAKSQITKNLENTIFNVKRIIGRNYDDPKIQQDMKDWPFKVVNAGGKSKICAEFKGQKKFFYPEEISAMILIKMKEAAETYFCKKVVDAVISVPAYFNNSQRQATIDAGKIAGLNVKRILNEPSAAALAYGLHKNFRCEGEKNILIFDLGGGFLDVSILNIEYGSCFQVVSTVGDIHLGGEDFDSRIVAHFVEEFRKKHNKDLRTNPISLRRLRNECVRVKCNLSSCTKANIEIEALFDGIDFYSQISRATFEELCMDLFLSTLEPVKRALKDARLDKRSINDIVLVGGSIRIPKIQDLLRDFFEGKELYMSINPDEAIACGAAVEAAVVTGSTNHMIKDVLLLDIAPLSFSIETPDGVTTEIIKRNTSVPWETSQIITTYADNGSSVCIQVFEGDLPIRKVKLAGTPPALRGVPQVELIFDLNIDGLLQVSIHDKSICQCQSIGITHEKEQFSKEEIERMFNKAKEFEKEDAAQLEKIAARNFLESYIYSEKQAAEIEAANKLSVAEKERIKNICMSVIHWLDCNTLAEKDEIELKLKETQAEFSLLMMKIH